jgi:hypothetical protein
MGEGMSFCPFCGLRVGEGPVAPSQVQMGGPPPSPAPYGSWPYPLQQMPQAPFPGYPYPYASPYGRTPINHRRALAIAGGILLIIGGSFALFVGIVFAFETDWNDSAGWISIMNITAFCLSIVGAIAAFRRFWRLMALVGPAFLVAASIVSLIDIGLFAVLLLVLGILSLVFMAIGYNEMTPAPWPGWSQGAAGMGYIPPGSAQQVSPFGGGDPGGRTGRS